MDVYILDLESYDARGGSAQVFATLAGAQASLPHITWREDGDGRWVDAADRHSVDDLWAITRDELGP